VKLITSGENVAKFFEDIAEIKKNWLFVSRQSCWTYAQPSRAKHRIPVTPHGKRSTRSVVVTSME
jgi:hypothetical protein